MMTKDTNTIGISFIYLAAALSMFVSVMTVCRNSGTEQLKPIQTAAPPLPSVLDPFSFSGEPSERNAMEKNHYQVFPFKYSLLTPSPMLKPKGLYWTLPNASRADLPRIAELKPQGLEFGHSRIDDRALSELSKIQSLRVLFLQQCPKITEDGLRHLSDLKQLSTLSIERNGFTDDALIALSKVRSLRNLHLSVNRFTDRGLEKLSDLPQISFLDLSNTSVTGPALEKTLRGKHLLTLVLTDMFLTDADLACISRIDVDNLCLARNVLITDAGVRHLAAMTELKRLDLSKCPKVTQAGLGKLQDALPKCRFGPIGAAVFTVQ